MAAHVLHQGLACCGSTVAQPGRDEWGGLRMASRAVGVGVGVGEGVWAAGEVGLWWTLAAPDETQPATRAKRAETDKSDGTPAWTNHGASCPEKAGRFLLT